ncbi:MAG: acyl carrier protein [Halobacteriovoraceae bacterium]|nr:acyl carrier protein [Halobacteriovoraceae bacterium]|tara:strand:- start:2500 stop:2733 length:234 start_codon:yes stop_codon:yes gene_type:complete
MEIQDKVINIVSEAANVEAGNIKSETSFIDDLNLDSLDMVEMMMKMEEEFGIEIPEEKTEDLKTIGDVAKYLKDNAN